jgi:hypothetical protein
LPIWGVVLLVVWILTIIPPISLILLVLAIILAMNGHKLAWKYRQYPGGYPQYMQVENSWSTVGMVLFFVWALAVVPLTAILAAILFPVFAKAREKAREEAAHGSACIQKHTVAHIASASLEGTHFLLPRSGVTIRA